MLYQILKIPARLALILYCRSIKINKPHFLKTKGPLLIAANHPNSFLDAIIIATLFRQPVYSLTRGDVYKNSFYTKLLTSLKMLPVYRISEGAENLGQNYDTFEKCKKIFKKNGIVLIFSEGRCENEWKLRPLKKGTARLAISSWEEGIDLKILPAGINYQSFLSFGKNIELNFGETIQKNDLDHTNGFGKMIIEFNEILKNKLLPLVVHIKETDAENIRQHFYVKQDSLKKVLLAIPAITGWVVHAFIYRPARKYTRKAAGGTGHYDSVLIAVLFVAYPLFLALVAVLMSIFLPGYWWMLTLVFLPFCAWAYIQLKHQF